MIRGLPPSFSPSPFRRPERLAAEHEIYKQEDDEGGDGEDEEADAEEDPSSAVDLIGASELGRRTAGDPRGTVAARRRLAVDQLEQPVSWAADDGALAEHPDRAL